MDTSECIRLRTPADQLAALLNQLDSGPTPYMSRRADERRPYRNTTVVAELREPAGGWTRCRAASRNVSRTGMGLLVGRFVYPGTRCRVYVWDKAAKAARVLAGIVMHCRYLPETATIHEVGMRFDQPVELADLGLRDPDAALAEAAS